MTQKEIDAIRPGDIIYDIQQNKEYYIIKKESGWVQYEDNVGYGTIPLTQILRWNFVSLMRDREPERLTWEDMKAIQTLIPELAESEEDDMLMDELESYILYDEEFNDEQKSWRIKRLKSLRPQPKQEWSEEDKHNIEEVISILEESGRYLNDNNNLLIDWLKLLPKRFNLSPKHWHKI